MVDQDLDEDVDISADEHHSRVDVEVLVEDPQVIPWSLYHDNEDTAAVKYGYRFPDSIEFLADRDVWRGLESLEGLTLSKLLSKFNFLGGAHDATEGLMKLEAASNCSITHNMAGNVVYVGSDSGAHCVNNALRKLWNLLGLWVRSPCPRQFANINAFSIPSRAELLTWYSRRVKGLFSSSIAISLILNYSGSPTSIPIFRNQTESIHTSYMLQP